MSSPKATLARYGLHPKRSFGQNFLADAQLLTRLAALVGPRSRVIEIGAGLGALTRSLLAAGHRLAAIERDRDLLPVLREEFDEEISRGQLLLVEADAKKVDYPTLFQRLAEPGPPGPDSESAAGDEETTSAWPCALVGNLPYQLTGPLMRLSIDLAPQLAKALFLVQLEVADRLCAEVDSEPYGMLSVFSQAAFRAKREMIVRRGAFYPQPRVDSAVVSLEPIEPHPGTKADVFQKLVIAAFQQRRKRLKNAWSQLTEHEIDATRLARAASRVGVDLQQRGETLSAAQYAALAEALTEG